MDNDKRQGGGNQHTTQGVEHTQRAAELPSTAFDQMVNNTVSMMTGAQASPPSATSQPSATQQSQQ